MKANEARQQGFRYTGVSNLGSSRDNFETRVEEFKKQGFKIAKVAERSSPQSRGGTISWLSLYVKYKPLKEAELNAVKSQILFDEEQLANTQNSMSVIKSKIQELETELSKLNTTVVEKNLALRENRFKVQDSLNP